MYCKRQTPQASCALIGIVQHAWDTCYHSLMPAQSSAAVRYANAFPSFKIGDQFAAAGLILRQPGGWCSRGGEVYVAATLRVDGGESESSCATLTCLRLEESCADILASFLVRCCCSFLLGVVMIDENEISISEVRHSPLDKNAARKIIPPLLTGRGAPNLNPRVGKENHHPNIQAAQTREDTLTWPFCGSRESREPCHSLKLVGNSNLVSQKRRRQQRHTISPSPSPRPPPEDRPISSTYPASQKKTAISRTEAQTIAAATEEEEAEKRAAAHQPRAIPQVRYDTRHPTAATRSRAVNTQRCSEVQGRCVVLCWSCLVSILFVSLPRSVWFSLCFSLFSLFSVHMYV